MQTEVFDNPPTGLPGGIYDSWTAANGDRPTRISEEETAGIPLGVMVAEGEAEGGALLIAANTDQLAGISVHGHWYAPNQLVAVLPEGDFGYKPGVAFAIGRTGRYRVLIEENVAKGDEVHVRAVAVTNDGEVAGAFRASDDGTDTINVSDFCSWVRGGEVDGDFGYAIVEVNMGLAPLASADS